jgi:transposase InsO family protein
LPEVRDVILAVLDREYLTKQKPSLAVAVRAIRMECTNRGLSPPSYSSVQRLLCKIDALVVAKRRGDAALLEQLSLTPGTYDVREPMAVWQIDHTLMDLILISELDHVPIGRPWLTLIIDVASRMVAGYYLSLDPPSALSVARALTMAVRRKDEILARHGIDGRWPVFGLPRALHSDNASEFARSQAYRRALHFKTLEYSSPLLAELRRKNYSNRERNRPIEFRYDPSNLSEIFVQDSHGRHQAVPLNHPGQPVVTLWEVSAELQRRRVLRAGPSTSALTIAGIQQQRATLLERGGPRQARALERLRHHGIEPDASQHQSTSGRWDEILGGDQ